MQELICDIVRPRRFRFFFQLATQLIKRSYTLTLSKTQPTCLKNSQKFPSIDMKKKQEEGRGAKKASCLG